MAALIAACLWVVAANVIAMLPSRDYHWTWAYVLIAVGLPILVWVIWTNGIFAGLLFLLAGASILRWPVRYAWRWVRRILLGRKQQ